MHRPSFLRGRFRTGTSFQLKEWTTLGQQEKQWLRELADSDEVYGLFVPVQTGSQLTAKIAGTDAALLFYHFQQHISLPNYFLNRIDVELQNAVMRLVLDGILEIEWNGTFVSGSGAVPAMYPTQTSAGEAAANYLSTLSMQAISNAFLLKRKNARQMAQWLYTCHTMPATALKGVALSTESEVYHYLTSAAQQLTPAFLNQWRFAPPQDGFRWFAWTRTDAYHEGVEPTYKLYISPQLHRLPVVFGNLLSILAHSDAFCFKAGASTTGLLRPDKLLVYFSTRAAMMHMAEDLSPLLQNEPVQGVPFTAQLDQRGLLSWGVDPPATKVLQAVEDGSWRTMVTEQLAVAILQAKQQQQAWPEAASFLAARLHTAGINLHDWTPANFET